MNAPRLVTLSQFCRELSAVIDNLTPEQKADIRAATMTKVQRREDDRLLRMPPATNLIQ